VSRVVDRALNALAHVALRYAAPARARTIVSIAARALPRLSPDDGRRLADRLGTRGTCLSRALAVASRLEGARVAIGVTFTAGAPLSAHAWVVYDGAPLRPSDPAGEVIALLDAAADWGSYGDAFGARRPT